MTRRKEPTSGLSTVIRVFAWGVMTKYTAGSMTYIRDANGNVALVKPRRYSKQWTFPGGFHRGFEEPAEAATREAREETGLELTKVADSQGLRAVTTYRQAYARHFDHLFYCAIPFVEPELSRRKRFWNLVEIGETEWKDPSHPEFRELLSREALDAYNHYEKWMRNL